MISFLLASVYFTCAKLIADKVSNPELQVKMSDDGWGDDDAGWTNGDAAAAPAAGAGDEEVEEEEEKPRGGGDGKCRNCRQVKEFLQDVFVCSLLNENRFFDFRKGTLLPTAPSQRCVESVRR